MTELTQQRKELAKLVTKVKDPRIATVCSLVATPEGVANIFMPWLEAAFGAGRFSLESERQAIMKSLSITFDPGLGAEGQGYEAPAEPEPKYFATLAEAVEFEFKLVARECDKAESENARLREEKWQDIEFVWAGLNAGCSRDEIMASLKSQESKRRGAIRGGTNVEIP